MNQKKVNQAVEAYCNMGCTSVNAIIHTLESGNRVDGIEDFSEAEIKAVATELKAIMAVYESED